MALTSISITPQFGNSTVTAINCGTSIPRLSGTIDISMFPNLTGFICNNNDISQLSGTQNTSGLQYLDLGNNKLTGTINEIYPNIDLNANLYVFYCDNNLLSGIIPNFNNNTVIFHCGGNKSISGPIPNLNTNTKLQGFYCYTNRISGEIPKLNFNTSLNEFLCNINFLSGSIPSLSNAPFLFNFLCNGNLLTDFDGGQVSDNLGNFQAQSNQLNQSAVNAILSAFDATTRTTGTRNLFLQAGTNAAPSYTGGVTTTSPGTNFSRSGTLVTANVTGHGHPNGSLVTISGITPTAFQGTFVISVVNANQFQYTTQTSGTVTGTGTATMRRTTVATDGFRYYQNLALVTRLGGFPWNVNINFP